MRAIAKNESRRNTALKFGRSLPRQAMLATLGATRALDRGHECYKAEDWAGAISEYGSGIKLMVKKGLADVSLMTELRAKRSECCMRVLRSDEDVSDDDSHDCYLALIDDCGYLVDEARPGPELVVRYSLWRAEATMGSWRLDPASSSVMAKVAVMRDINTVLGIKAAGAGERSAAERLRDELNKLIVSEATSPAPPPPPPPPPHPVLPTPPAVPPLPIAELGSTRSAEGTLPVPGELDFDGDLVRAHYAYPAHADAHAPPSTVPIVPTLATWKGALELEVAGESEDGGAALFAQYAY